MGADVMIGRVNTDSHSNHIGKRREVIGMGLDTDDGLNFFTRLAGNRNHSVEILVDKQPHEHLQTANRIRK